LEHRRAIFCSSQFKSIWIFLNKSKFSLFLRARGSRLSSWPPPRPMNKSPYRTPTPAQPPLLTCHVADRRLLPCHYRPPGPPSPPRLSCRTPSPSSSTRPFSSPFLVEALLCSCCPSRCHELTADSHLRCPFTPTTAQNRSAPTRSHSTWRHHPYRPTVSINIRFFPFINSAGQRYRRQLDTIGEPLVQVVVLQALWESTNFSDLLYLRFGGRIIVFLTAAHCHISLSGASLAQSL
jgi:hypothetical protein